jgi:hypothetical protein
MFYLPSGKAKGGDFTLLFDRGATESRLAAVRDQLIKPLISLIWAAVAAESAFSEASTHSCRSQMPTPPTA